LQNPTAGRCDFVEDAIPTVPHESELYCNLLPSLINQRACALQQGTSPRHLERDEGVNCTAFIPGARCGEIFQPHSEVAQIFGWQVNAAATQVGG
jgi:hypothetical protein